MYNTHYLEQQAKLYREELLEEAYRERLLDRVRERNRQERFPGHAIVIGSSIAGLTAANVLADHVAHVTIIDRDHLPTTPSYRSGVPQCRHGHVLLAEGQILLEQQFPGLADELLAHGAVAVDLATENASFSRGRRMTPDYRSSFPSISSSRPLLETTLYQRVAAHPRVRVLQGHDAVGLSVDDEGIYVTGVHLRDRSASESTEQHLAGDLVIDASGRRSRAPLWLASLGYTPPQETTVNAFSGYTTRLYQRPGMLDVDWKKLYVAPTPPDQTCGGAIVPIEEDRWYVMLIGMAGDFPPTDEAGFLAFARSLHTQALYEAIKDARPLSKPYGYRHAVNRVRHYDKLPRYLEGFLVLGDAAYAPNPVYSQGMTMAAVGSRALDRTLKAQHRQLAAGQIQGLAKRFHKQLSRDMKPLWQQAIMQDQEWPTTEVVESGLPAQLRPAEIGAL
ncbi:MAG: FAD-dependent monooxygenase [Chloroflexota bacterium]|nr:FAD-dependent monooxygenase [Chloroflexota bacterium]